MNAFHVLGGILALWALVVTALGLSRHDFPGSKAGERIVIMISVTLVAAAMLSGIITAANEDEGEAEAAHGTPAAAHGEGGESEAKPAEGETKPAGEAPAGGGAPAGEGGGEEIELAADASGKLAYDKDSLEAKAGKVTIVMQNPSPLPHNVVIEDGGPDAEGEVVDKGGTSTASAELEPGTFVYFCSVPGHREGGMEGELTVR